MSTAAAESQTGGKSPWILAAVVGTAAFMEVLDTSIANVALSHIAGSLAATPEEATWVLTSYLVSNAIILPMTGWLANSIGRRRYYIGSMALFVIASVLCGLAPSLPLLIAARILQGLAGGALQPVSQAILADAFPPEKRGMAMAIYGMAMMGGPIFGPPVGGLITEYYSWHWVFLINAPVGALLITAALRLIHDSPEQLEAQRRRREEPFSVDYLGFALIVLGIGSLQVMLDLGQQRDWLASGFIQICLLVSVFAILSLIWWELRHPHPVINLRLLKNPNFAIANIMMLALGTSLFGSVVLMPQFTQSLLGYSAMDAGIIMSPPSVVLMFIMPLAARMATRTDMRLMVSAGFVMASMGMYITAIQLNTDITMSQLMWLRLFQVIGMAFLMVPISTIAYVGLPPGEGGNASAIMNLTRNLGASLGISLAVAMLAHGSQTHHAQLVDRVSVLDPVYQERFAALSAGLGDERAQAVIGGMVQQQATLMAYISDFQLFSLLMLLVSPLIWFARQPPKFGPPPPAGH